MSTRKWILSIIAISVAIGCIALGFWQLRRLSARHKQNAIIAARRLAPPVELDSLPSDTAAAHFRRVRIVGNYDHGQGIVFTFRLSTRSSWG